MKRTEYLYGISLDEIPNAVLKAIEFNRKMLNRERYNPNLNRVFV